MILKLIDKPWGTEEWLYVGEYAVKRLTVYSGKRLSLQYHRTKHETLYCVAGRGILTLNDRILNVENGTFAVIAAGVKHRLTAITQLVVLECSTPKLDDVVRLEDDYGRVGEHEDSAS